MATIESLLAFSEAIKSSVAPGASNADVLASPELALAACAKQWQSSVESKLTEWGEASEGADQDGLAPPGRNTISVALQIAAELRNAGVSVPLRLVQDGDGGIVFEWKHGANSDKLRLDASGRIEAMGFCDSRLVYRYPISFTLS